MSRHYLVISARSMFQHKLYSLINVVGLSVALACAILILLFVRDQLSYDNWIPGTENLYQLEVTWHLPGGQTLSTVLSPFPVANAMKSEIPGVTTATHLVPEQMTQPTGNLDSATGEEVMQLLTELNGEGTTIIMVTHSRPHAKYAHRIVNLLDGAIVTEKVRLAV